MAGSAEWVRGAIGAHLDAERERARDEVLGGGDAAVVRRAERARAALGDGEARERLEEALRTGALDPSSHGALLAHVARAAEQEVLSRRSVPLGLPASERVVVADRERTLVELAGDARGPDPVRARQALKACAARIGADRAARLEAFADAAERGARIRARGEPAPDAAPEDLAERCASFVSETDDAAAELVARAEHELRGEPPSLARRLRALSVPALDGLVAPRGRARRAEASFAALGLEGELARRVEIRGGTLFQLRPISIAAVGRTTLVTSPVELGLPSERAFLGGVAEALALALASPALPVELAHPTHGSVARTLGALFEHGLADPAYAARCLGASKSESARIALVSAATALLEARLACATWLASPEARAVDATRERAARALVLDPSLVPLELALGSRERPGARERAARATLAAFALWPRLRDRYDEDFLRNPRFSDTFRGAAARGAALGTETLLVELDGSPEDAVRRARELAGG